MANEIKRAKITGSLQPKWINFTGIGLALAGIAAIIWPRGR